MQSGIFETLMGWGMFLCLCFLHYLNFKDTDAKKRAVADCVYYGMLVGWYVGTIIHYSVE